MVDTVGGELKSVQLSSLRPDWRNPRFPPGSAHRFRTDKDVYAYLDKQFDAASVAESIARHGFFLSEPLIAIPDDNSQAEQNNDTDIPVARKQYIVLEGNRRLAALQGLANASTRAMMTDPRWKNFENPLELPSFVPVLIAPSREHVAPILGYRHVTGIAPWDPYQQARYVASLIDDENNPLSASQVARLIGRNVSEVRSFYRNYSIVEQARDIFDMADPNRIVDEFGVWTRAMTSSSIRGYIDAPVPRDVQENTYPLPGDAIGPLERLVTWIFGAPRSEEEMTAGRQSKVGRVISDSRQLTRLGSVLANQRGAAALEAGATLEAAEVAALDENVRFAEALGNARKELGVASDNANRGRVRDNATILEDVERYVYNIKGAS